MTQAILLFKHHLLSLNNLPKERVDMKITRRHLRRVISEVLAEGNPVDPGPSAAELKGLAQRYLSSSDLEAAGYSDWAEEKKKSVSPILVDLMSLMREVLDVTPHFHSGATDSLESMVESLIEKHGDPDDFLDKHVIESPGA
jgi:hypothetical protein